jgi:hypothetical protein
MRKDTGHKIYTGSGRQGGEPYVLFGDQVWHPALGVGLFRCPARYPALLYIVQGGGFIVGYKAGVLVGLHGMSPSRITRNSSRSPSSSFLAWVPGEYARQQHQVWVIVSIRFKY